MRQTATAADREMIKASDNYAYLRTRLLARILAVLKARPQGSSMRQVCALVVGRDAWIRAGLRLLGEIDQASCEAGPRGAWIWYLRPQ